MTCAKLCAVFVLAALLLAAANPIVGTWKMNLEKSKFSPGPAPKNVTAVYSEDGDWIVVKADGVDGAGQPINRSNRYRMDGNAYPYDGPNGKGQITVKKINDHTYEAVTKYDNGQAVTTRTMISKDGKTRTQTSRGVDAKGQKVNSVVVFERQ